MREICLSGSEGGAGQSNASSLPLSFLDPVRRRSRPLSWEALGLTPMPQKVGLTPMP